MRGSEVNLEQDVGKLQEQRKSAQFYSHLLNNLQFLLIKKYKIKCILL